MEELFSIGEVAKYQKISKQTLIFYDKIGLFKPARVDPNNGYRYYSAAQLDYLDTILIMKKIGFSLEEIRLHMQSYTIDTSLAALQGQLQVLDRRIEELQLIRSRLRHRCRQMDAAKGYRAASQRVTVEQTPGHYIFYHTVQPPYSPREISIATKRCFADAFQRQLPVFFQCGVAVPKEKAMDGRCTQASLAFLPIEKVAGVKNLRRLPAGLCACIYHVGGYASIGRSYRALLGYCAAQGLAVVSDAYESCINDYITTRDENEYITKIMFYVQAPQTPGAAG